MSSLLAAKGFDVYAMGSMEKSGAKENLDKLFNSRVVQLLLDASQPFPGGISKHAQSLCHDNQIPYIRLARREVELPDSPLLYPVYSWEEAALKAAELGNTIFLTTGSYNLDLFVRHPHMGGKRIVVRVLPDPQVIEKVQALGIAPKNIVAMQGPFSREINKATFKMYNASVIVTKDSGNAGGTDNKISAALNLKIPVVIIKRPEIKGEDINIAYTFDQVFEFIQNVCNNRCS